MDEATALLKVKRKLDIPSADNSFDDILNDCMEQGVLRLRPFINTQSKTTLTVADDSSSLTLPSDIGSIEYIYYTAPSSDQRMICDLWTKFADMIYFDDTNVVNGSTVDILHLTHYEFSDASLAALANENPAALLPFYLFSMAEFATYIIGNKRKFNIYQSMSGVRTLSEMQELVEFYENRALRILEDDISAEGQ